MASLVMRLTETPNLFLDEMARWIFDVHNIAVDPSTVSRALKRIGWSNRQVRLALLIGMGVVLTFSL